MEKELRLIESLMIITAESIFEIHPCSTGADAIKEVYHALVRAKLEILQNIPERTEQLESFKKIWIRNVSID
jgi:hypothetical protein